MKTTCGERKVYKKEYSEMHLRDITELMDETRFAIEIRSCGYTREQRKRAVEAGELAILREFEQMKEEQGE